MRGDAASKVAATCTAGGVPVSARQVERWTQRGFLPRPVRVGLGRGLGTSAHYPPETTELASFIGVGVRRGTPLEQIGVAMFAGGMSLPADGVRRSLSWLVVKCFHDQPVGTTGQDDVDDLLDAFEPAAALLAARRDPFTVAQRKQSKRWIPSELPRAVVSSAWSALFLNLAGHEVSDESLAELLVVFGADALSSDADSDELVARLRTHLGVFSPERLKKAAELAPINELTAIRDAYLVGLEGLDGVRDELAKIPDLQGSPFHRSLDVLASDIGICLSVLGRWSEARPTHP